MSWDKHWEDIYAAVRAAGNRDEAAASAAQVRGIPTSWDALDRAARRRGIRSLHKEIGAARKYSTIKGDLNAYLKEQHPFEDLLKVVANRAVPTRKARKPGRKHLIIPDTQTKPGVPLEHHLWIGRYIAEKQPDVVVHLGDHWDMPSLSSYDSPARKAREGRLVTADIQAGNEALYLLLEGMDGFQPEEKYLIEGNHDGLLGPGRVKRYLDENTTEEGLIHLGMFADQELGWTRVPFLDHIEVDGILYSHLFPFTMKGTVTAGSSRTGAASANAQLRAMMRSCTAGHKQGLDWAMHHTPSRTYRSVIAGSCYLHDEEYMGPGNRHWRGILVKHDVSDSNPNHYDLMEVSLDFLKRRYS